MNHRDRAMAAMRGKPVDHIPFIGRMDLWYLFHRHQGTLPTPYRNADLWDIQRDLGIGIFGFGMGAVPFCKLEYPGTEKSVEAGVVTTRYETPYGILTCRDRLWGGLASVILTEVFTEDEFEGYLEALFQAIATGDRFILGFGDNVPTDALFHRVRRVAEFWAEDGTRPLAG